MELEFYKYQGTGNDFVMIDNRSNTFPKENTQLVAHLCDRRFGIGADGLILLDTDATTDFRMVYYNSDGNLSSMCGNGGRCLVAFAKKLNVIQNETTFIATDGLHHATVGADGIVSLQMIDVAEIKIVLGLGLVIQRGHEHAVVEEVQFESDVLTPAVRDRRAREALEIGARVVESP